MLHPLDSFCKLQFWDIEEVWNTTNPNFSLCFQKTVLIWIPCGFIWCMIPLEIYYLIKSTSRHIPWTAINLTKLIIMILLVLLTIIDMADSVYQYQQGIDVPSVNYYASFILCITFILTITFQIFEKRRGIQSSGIIFIFWLLMAITGVVTYRTYLMQVYVINRLSLVLYMIYYPLVVAMFLLVCIADGAPSYKELDDKEENPCPEKEASFLSTLFFSWFDSLAWHGYHNPLEMKDLYSLDPKDKSNHVVSSFETHWNKSRTFNRQKSSFSSYKQKVFITVTSESQRKSFAVALMASLKGILLHAVLLRLFCDLIVFISPLMLDRLIRFISSDEPVWRGFLYTGILFCCSSMQTICASQYFNIVIRGGLRARMATIAAIYKKALVLSNSARKSSTVGEIVNLMSVDAQRFVELSFFLNMVWSEPLRIAIALYFLWNILGPSALAGLGVMILLIPINGFIVTALRKFQTIQMKIKDERVKLMNEILNGMKVLKLYAWEPSFQLQIQNIREKELAVMKSMAFLQAISAFVWMCAPFVVALATFATYVLTDESHVLDATKAFVSLSLFNIIRLPMTLIPAMLANFVQASVSIKRLTKFFNLAELDDNCVLHDNYEVNPVSVEEASFSWGSEETPTLTNVNLQIPEGSLVAVVGPVGCGKSSLIYALLGEMNKLEGRVCTKGSVAYAAQQAWMQNVTLRDNILFGKKFNNEFYQKVLDSCALKPDLEVLAAGDLTEIGEKGINLSGGQKQRISLARAIYCDADVYLLDDVLSAVDAHVGKHIFNKVIGPQGMLNRKTRIFVTHGITFLPQVDKIVVISNGSISEVGTYNELLEKKGAFAVFLASYLQNESEEDIDIEGLEEMKDEILSKIGSPELERHFSRQFSRQLSRQLSATKSHHSSEETGSVRNFSRLTSQISQESHRSEGEKKKSTAAAAVLIEKEAVETGQVKFAVYLYYYSSMGLPLAALVLGFYCISQSFGIGSNLWLSEWSNDSPDINGTVDTALRDLRLGVYGALGLSQAIFLLIGAFVVFAFGCIKASRLLHADILINILKSPMSFFDTTPLGRIMNRFSKDVDAVDTFIPILSVNVLTCLLEAFGTIIIISINLPIFLAAVVPLAVIYFFIQRIYIAASRQLKRLESTTRSPIFSHFSETVTGVSTIRAYGKQKDFIAMSEEKVDENQIPSYLVQISNRWVAVRLEIVGIAIVLATSLFAVLARATANAGIVGLSISYALSITNLLNWIVRLGGDLENSVVSVERIKEYSVTPTEAPWRNESVKLPKNWPEKGTISVKKYSTRYREGLDLTLKGVSFDIKDGEKVGIVGRTGAGKSSLTLALFRLIEPASGSIIIDGVDISQIGLHDLRSRLTIIPQEPVLFSGTLRLNLDPFNIHSDEDIWTALEHSHLKNFVLALASGLLHEVTEGGENLSVGQRQLICLARALLRKTKILVLDEATAAVDLQTDDLIQSTIRKEFANCTVLTIAHRLNTIMDSNRVIVLDSGTIKEFDSPSNLLKNKQSYFHSMAKEAGLL